MGTARLECTCRGFTEGLSGALGEVFVRRERLRRACRPRVQQGLTLAQAHVCEVAAQVAVVEVRGELMEGEVMSRQGKGAL